MIKVIFLSKFNSYDEDIPLYRPGTDAFLQFGMGLFIAQEFIKRDYPIQFENWRTDLRITEVLEKEISGICYRIFPSKKYPRFGEYSSTLVQALKSEAGKFETVFHFMPNHPINYHYYSGYIKTNRIVATHIGGANPYWYYKNEKGKRKYLSWVYYQMEKMLFLKNYDHFIAMCQPEVEYYRMLKKPVTHMPVFGISREYLFTISERNESREKLGLPQDKKILLQVGRAYEARGFDWIMDIIDHYQKKDDYFLVFAGINKTDKYYPHLKQKSVFMTPYLSQVELPDYYNAADLLYYLPHGKMDLNFAGTSYVPLEAMACGTPVVATTFHHFPGEEVSEVSRIPKQREDVIPMIDDLLMSEISRDRCREIVLKNFSWDEIIKKHWEIYNG